MTGKRPRRRSHAPNRPPHARCCRGHAMPPADNKKVPENGFSSHLHGRRVSRLLDSRVQVCPTMRLGGPNTPNGPTVRACRSCRMPGAGRARPDRLSLLPGVPIRPHPICLGCGPFSREIPNRAGCSSPMARKTLLEGQPSKPVPRHLGPRPRRTPYQAPPIAENFPQAPNPFLINNRLTRLSRTFCLIIGPGILPQKNASTTSRTPRSQAEAKDAKNLTPRMESWLPMGCGFSAGGPPLFIRPVFFRRVARLPRGPWTAGRFRQFPPPVRKTCVEARRGLKGFHL